MSTAALPVHVAIVDDTGSIQMSELQKVAGALNKQVTDEFFDDWKVLASVGAYYPDAVPTGCWAVRIQQKLDQPGALGYHTDDHNQPISYVELTNDYTVTVSHEILEMLVDPWGNRLQSAESPLGIDPSQFGITEHDRVEYLVEACDPCERASYLVGGVPASDYMLKRWYRTAPGRNRWFSHLGTCVEPREVADGGYVSFATANKEWWQVFNEGGSLRIQNLGAFSKGQYGSLREFTDVKAREHRNTVA